MASVRANPIAKSKNSITIKPIDKTTPELDMFKVLLK